MTALSSQDQFEIAAVQLEMTQGAMMSNFYTLAVALYRIDRMKVKAAKIMKLAPDFQQKLRKLASGEVGLANANRLKDMMRGFKADVLALQTLQKDLQEAVFPVLEKLKGERFEETFLDLHVKAARFEAVASRWIIIITEANNPDQTRPIVNRIKGMHEVMVASSKED